VQAINLKDIDRQIKVIKQAVSDLSIARKQFPAVDRNLVRLSASLKMLELNVSDVIGVNQ
jgi:hypothetical protein